MMSSVNVSKSWVLADDGTPFYTSEWAPSTASPKAYILFVHGFAEHITRYDKFFRLLAAEPHNLHITAFDQRGHGLTAYQPLTDTSPEVVAWKDEGRAVKPIKNGGRKTGGWAQVFPDMEFFVKRESERAVQAGKKLFLWGHTSPPNPSTVALLSGAIISGPLIRQTHPAPYLQLKAGSLASHITPNLLIAAPLKYEDLTHDPEVQEANRLDPLCEQKGSVLGVADMLQGGMTLDTPETWKRWPGALPLMMYHGSDDQICDPEATKRFFAGVEAPRKRLEIIEGMRHETHNELEPTPSDLARMVVEWVGEVVDASIPDVGPSKL